MRAPATLAAAGAVAASLLALGPATATAGASGGWKRADLRPISQPAAVGNRFALYAAHGGAIQLLVLDARTGRTVWSRPASSGSNAPGQPPALVAGDGLIVYLSKAAGSAARLAAVDATTGAHRWQSPVGDFTSWPSICPDEADAVCLTGEAAVLRFGLQTGELLQAVRFSTSPSGREVGAGLYDPGTRKPELLEASRGAVLAWRERLDTVFPSPAGASTDYGWNFDRYNRLGLFVGSPGWPPIVQGRTTAVIDLARAMTAGFRIRDGKTLWRDPGSLYVCNYLPCAGQSNPSVSTPAGIRTEPTVGIRLRIKGRITVHYGAKPPIVAAGSDVTLEGFDPATGKKRWAFDAGEDDGLIGQTLLPPQTGPASIALRTPTAYLELDLATGARHRLSRSATGWCRRLTHYRQSTPYNASNGRAIHDYIGQFGVFRCTLDGRPAPAPARVPSFLAGLGGESDGMVAWSDTTGVTAAPVSRSS